MRYWQVSPTAFNGRVLPTQCVKDQDQGMLPNAHLLESKTFNFLGVSSILYISICE